MRHEDVPKNMGEYNRTIAREHRNMVIWCGLVVQALVVLYAITGFLAAAFCAFIFAGLAFAEMLSYRDRVKQIEKDQQ